MNDENSQSFPEIIQVAELPEYQQRDDVVLLDIRQKDDFDKENVPDSMNVPSENLQSELNYLDDEVHYIVMCPHGIAAVGVAQFLRDNDFSAAVLVGGLCALGID